jgi:zinc D-Ala-D-Ala dipeptidase
MAGSLRGRTTKTSVLVFGRVMLSGVRLCVPFIVLAVLASLALAQSPCEAGIGFKPARPIEELQAEALRATPPHESGDLRVPDLVELTRFDVTIKLDIRYATSNNFLGAAVYSEARAFLDRSAAEALKRASQALRHEGYGLVIFDGYRPWYVSKIFWDAVPCDATIKQDYVANPATGSIHNRGCAVDLTLYDLQTGEEVEMPTDFDEMSTRAAADDPRGTEEQRAHRKILRDAMEREGFTVEKTEWWHFNYRDAKQYAIMNVRFEQIHDSGNR